jgi:hypothetical protein
MSEHLGAVFSEIRNEFKELEKLGFVGLETQLPTVSQAESDIEDSFRTILDNLGKVRREIEYYFEKMGSI